MTKNILAWHFLPGDKKLNHGSGIKVRRGKTLKCDPDKLDICHYGFHASKKPIDALSYLNFSDAIICRVKLGGKIIKQEDKLCASERTVISWCKADPILHAFGIWCAEEVLPIFEKQYPNDKRPRLAIEAKKKWLKKEITDSELGTACGAAWAAACGTACGAAWAAARAAACGAARAAARAAEKKKQNKMLEKMFLKGMKK
jgi:hypothetical protein